MSTVTSGPKGALFPTTVIAGAAIIKNRAVKRGGDSNHAIQATAGSLNLGIAMDAQDTAERTFPLAYRPGETVLVEAGAAIAADAYGKSDSVGRIILAASGDLITVVVREAATAAGQLISAEILPPGTKAP